MHLRRIGIRRSRPRARSRLDRAWCVAMKTGEVSKKLKRGNRLTFHTKLKIVTAYQDFSRKFVRAAGN